MGPPSQRGGEHSWLPLGGVVLGPPRGILLVVKSQASVQNTLGRVAGHPRREGFSPCTPGGAPHLCLRGLRRLT